MPPQALPRGREPAFRHQWPSRYHRPQRTFLCDGAGEPSPHFDLTAFERVGCRRLPGDDARFTRSTSPCSRGSACGGTRRTTCDHRDRARGSLMQSEISAACSAQQGAALPLKSSAKLSGTVVISHPVRSLSSDGPEASTPLWKCHSAPHALGSGTVRPGDSPGWSKHSCSLSSFEQLFGERVGRMSVRPRSCSLSSRRGLWTDCLHAQPSCAATPFALSPRGDGFSTCNLALGEHPPIAPGRPLPTWSSSSFAATR